jgi:small-conductance mechanosensitive channel
MVLLRAIWRSVVILLVAGVALQGAVRAQEAPAETPAAEAPAAEAPADAAPAEGAPEEAPPEEDLDAMLAEATARVAELEEQASNLLQGPPDPQLVDRLELWRDFVNQLRMRVSQRIEKESAQTKLRSIEGALAGFSETGLSEEPPYTIDFIDQLRDNLDSTQRDLLTVQLADEAARAALSRAEAQFKQAEEARRKARDAVSANNDQALSARLQNDMVRAQLASRIAWQRQHVATARGEVAEINLKIARTLVSLTQARLEAAQEQAVFPEELLETKRADITTRREELESELAKLRKTQEANERQLAEARAAMGSLTDEAERPRMIERVTARSAWVESSNAAIQYFEQRIARSGDEQTLWERRHAMMQPDADIPYNEWARETRTLLDELSRTKALLEARLNDLRTNQIELENLLAAESGGPADPEAARSRLDALRKHEAQAREYAARLIRIERLALRLNESLTAVLASGTWLERLAQWWQKADDIWERELFVVEDRGFNLAKLTQSGGAFAIVLVIAWAIRLVLRRTVLRRLVASQQQVGSDSSFAIDVVLALVRDTKSLFIVLVAAYASVQPLNLPEGLSAKLDTMLFITVVLQVASWISEIVKRFLQREQRRREVSDPSTASVYGHFAFFGRVAIWSAVLLLVLNHMEYNITGIVTGLGIGGIAIAFALQNILGDIFCSLAILMDKPFIVGDFIVVGEQSGTVERIGIKTTRLRSIGGEEIVFSNADLIGSRVHNYKRMKERRVKFHFGVTYETELAKLRKIPEMVRKIIEFQEMARFDRVHFHLYGDFSLNFECVYFVLDADYKIYMDIQQAINLEIFDAFRRAGIDFAYPTTREIIDISSNRAEEIPEGVVKPN